MLQTASSWAQTPSDTAKGIDTLAAKSADTSQQNSGGIVDTLFYEAERINYSLENRTLQLFEGAQVRYQNIRLFADTIFYLINDDLFLARGKPMLLEGSDTTVGEHLSYNIKTRRGSVSFATTHMADEYFTGEKIVKSAENHLYIDQGDYTSCLQREEPHYFIYGKNIKVIPKQKAISRPVVINMGGSPVAVLPYFVMPMETNRSSGWLMPGWGGNPGRGGYIDNIGYYWAINDYMDFKATGMVREFEKLVLSADFNYRKRYWIPTGNLRFQYDLGQDYRQRDQKWALDFQHRQNLTPDETFTLAGGGTIMHTDIENRSVYQEHSRDYNEILNQTVRADLSLTKRFPSINASLNIKTSRVHDLTREHIVQDIPSIDFSLPSRPLIPFEEDALLPREDERNKPRWFNKIYYSYNSRGVVKQDDYTNPDSSANDFIRPGLVQNVNLSMRQELFEHITISPFFRAQLANFSGYKDTSASSYTPSRQERYDTLSLFDYPPGPSQEWDDYFYLPEEVDTLLPDELFRREDTLLVLTYYSEKLDSIPKFKEHDGVREDFDWDAGLSASTNLYGTFPLHFLSLRGIRHTLSPAISYTYRPTHEQRYQFYPIGISPASPRIKQAQVINLSIGNLVQAKTQEDGDSASAKGAAKTFTLFNFDLSTSYDFEKESLKWSDLQSSASTKIAFASLSASATFWLYDENNALSAPIPKNYSVRITPNNFSASGSFWNGDLLFYNGLLSKKELAYRNVGGQKWQLTLNPSYTFSASRRTPADIFVPDKRFDLSASAAIDFSPNWSMSYSSRFDFVRNEFEGHSFNFLADLECFALQFNWTPSGLRPGFYFKVNVKKIPDLKWELRAD
jgi:hypothetical protein